MKHLVAVYGSLRKGLGNHDVIQHTDTKFVGEDTISGWTMRSYGGFPYIHPGDGTIKVEVYQVSDDCLKENLDVLEGYPSFYNRKKVDTKYGKAWIYFIENETHDAYPLVESGDWVDWVENSNEF